MSINTDVHASLVEVAHRSRKELGWVQQQARQGQIAAHRHPRYGWLMGREEAEALIVRWKD